MEELIKAITNFDQINNIYQNNLFTLKSISQHLGEWNYLSEDEQYKLENHTTADSYLNGNIEEYYNSLKNYNGSEKFAYGEITKNGAESIYKWMKSNIGISENDVFYDIGSGHGKMVMHFALISNFKKLVGIELDNLRYKYCLEILSQIQCDNVTFINDDVLNCDISDATHVFINDALMSQELIHSIFSKLKPGTHIISIEENNFKPLANFDVEVSWMPIDLPFNYYLK